MTMNTVTWYDFAWDFNDDEQDLSDESRDKVQDLKSFTFDGEEYQALMKQILNQFLILMKLNLNMEIFP